MVEPRSWMGAWVSCVVVLGCLLVLVDVGDAVQRRTKKRKRDDPPIGCGRVLCTSITAPKTEITLGEPLVLQANVPDRGGEVLNFKWSATGGTIQGEGSTAVYTAPTDKAGYYAVIVEVSDEFGNTWDCSITIHVQPRNSSS